MSEATSRDPFEQVSTLSRALHGHRYVLSVAKWIIENELTHVASRDAMEALGGRADRARASEALKRLCEIGALREMPRDTYVNSPREFERLDDPYWDYVSVKLAHGARGLARSNTAGLSEADDA